MAKMKDFSAYGLRMYTEEEKYAPRSLLFGSILVAIHILSVHPSQFNTAGLAITFENVTILPGMIAGVFLYFGYRAVLARRMALDILPINRDFASMRHDIDLTKRSKILRAPTPKELKERVRTQIKVWNLFEAPFQITVFSMMTIAVGLSIYDLWQFGAYLIRTVC